MNEVITQNAPIISTPYKLGQELTATCHRAENAYGKGAPDTTDQVNGYRTHGVVQFQLVDERYPEER